MELWWKGPQWLAELERWPPDIVTRATQETLAKAKRVRELFKAAKAEEDKFDQILLKRSLCKALRICAWIPQFMCNTRGSRGFRVMGPLMMEEINQ